MSRILFVTFDGGGNQRPALGIARELATRGHTVAFLGHESQRSRIEAAGFAFTSYPSSPAWDGTAALAAAERRMRLIRNVFLDSHMVTDVLVVLERQPADLLVLDCLLFSAMIGAERADVPWVTLFHLFYGFLASVEGLLITPLNQLRAGLGLPTQASVMDSWADCPLVLVASLAELDPGSLSAPSNVRFIGPIVSREHPAINPPLPWEPGTADPLVLVSFSTVYQEGQAQALQRVLDALASLAIRVLVTTGPAVDPAALTAPVNATILPFLPHAALLPHVSLFVNHAGHASTMESLAHGVPLLCMPNPGADQPLVAARVEGSGAGRMISNQAGPEEIRSVATQLLGNPSYREAAQRLAMMINRQDSAARGAEELEALLSAPAGSQ